MGFLQQEYWSGLPFPSLWPHGLEHSRPPCPSPIPRVYPDSCLLSLLCCPLLLPPWIFPRIRVASNESAFHIRGPKYWSFSFTISPSNEHLGLTSFRIDWFDLLAAQGKCAWQRVVGLCSGLSTSHLSRVLPHEQGLCCLSWHHSLKSEAILTSAQYC